MVLLWFGVAIFTLVGTFWTGISLVVLRQGTAADRPAAWFGFARACGSFVVALFFALALIGVRGMLPNALLVVILVAAVANEILGRRIRSNEADSEVDSRTTGT